VAALLVLAAVKGPQRGGGRSGWGSGGVAGQPPHQLTWQLQNRALLGDFPGKIMCSQRLRESLSLLSGRADNPNECMPNESQRNLHSYRTQPPRFFSTEKNLC